MTKVEWQRKHRREFKVQHGYSTKAHYVTGGLRAQVLERDGYACLGCKMTDSEHKSKYGRPITIDHQNNNRSDNRLANLKTLCLECHGKKDGNKQQSKLRDKKEQVMRLRSSGSSCNSIAKKLGVGCKVVTKWVKRWNGGTI